MIKETQKEKRVESIPFESREVMLNFQFGPLKMKFDWLEKKATPCNLEEKRKLLDPEHLYRYSLDR
ncbi:MAG: hypothetical protein LBS00_12970 [Synergistaceae bacterium]|jgi:hypothetical protein|nr:hypothetical protein [Synergistaceae bacterium]